MSDTPRARLGAAILGGAAVFIALVWHAMSPPVAPLYDGLQLPPERYRYLQPPAGYAATQPPTSARTTIPIIGRTSPLMVASTSERPPQARLILEDGAVAVTSRLKSVTLTAKAIAAPSTAPTGSFESNVYEFTATDNTGAPVRFTPHANVSVALRTADVHASPVVERYSNGHWQPLPTQRYVNSTYYFANVKVLGAYALVLPGQSQGGGQSYLPLVVAGALAILLAVVALVLVRVSRGRTAEA